MMFHMLVAAAKGGGGGVWGVLTGFLTEIAKLGALAIVIGVAFITAGHLFSKNHAMVFITVLVACIPLFLIINPGHAATVLENSL